MRNQQRFVRIGSFCVDLSKVKYFGIDNNDREKLLIVFDNSHEWTLNTGAKELCEEMYLELVGKAVSTCDDDYEPEDEIDDENQYDDGDQF